VGAAVFYRARGNSREALLWVLLGVSTYLIQKILKIGIERPRPELWTSAIVLDNFAFPSGHAIAAATFYPLLARGVARRFPRRAKLAYAMAGAMTLYVGIGRLYLGVHWPSDVVAGWAIGFTQLGLAVWWMERRAIVPVLRSID
jgi:undecaprenyl-diphosphatase